VIEEPSDALYLTLDELRVTAASLPTVARHQAVEERRAEMAHFATVVPPSSIGKPPDGPPPADPFSRAFEKMFGAQPVPSADPAILRGNAASPGAVRGPARVIRRLSASRSIRDGQTIEVDGDAGLVRLV
jgi:hypothetical protein